MVVLLVVVAVVLLLVSRAWNEIAPTAVRLDPPKSAPELTIQAGGEGAAVGTDRLPDLGDVRRESDEHETQVQQAMSAGD
jgi:hypothetical protein